VLAVPADDPLYVERRDKNIKNISFCSIIGTIFVELLVNIIN
jgi:hypothetical protein